MHKKYLLTGLAILALSLPVTAQTWADLFAQHVVLNRHEQEYIKARMHVITKQYQAFTAGKAPIIVAPEITAIAIEENHDPLIDIKTTTSTRIQMLPDPATPFASPTHNSGTKNCSKIRAGLYYRLSLMVKHLDKLAPRFGYKPEQISIKVFEGLRDLETQAMIFEHKSARIRKEYPDWTAEQIYTETCKWVSPVKNNIPVHATGGAVDIRLWDTTTDSLLDMGTFGAAWGSNPTAPTFSEDISDAQKNNRLFCLMAANRADLTNYVYEFWHFSCNDRYAAYWLHETYGTTPVVARFGACKADTAPRSRL